MIGGSRNFFIVSCYPQSVSSARRHFFTFLSSAPPSLASVLEMRVSDAFIEGALFVKEGKMAVTKVEILELISKA